MTAKERYQRAYHRLRTLYSSQLYQERDSYPIGFDCKHYGECQWYGCDDDGSCSCQQHALEKDTAQAYVMLEAQRLLREEGPVDRPFLPLVARHLADRMTFLDAWGRDGQFPLNPLLARQLSAKRQHGRRAHA
jgi:hypothetical protein